MENTRNYASISLDYTNVSRHKIYSLDTGSQRLYPGGHKTDDLRDFGIDYPLTDDVRKRRAISWLYQYELMKSTPKPKNYIVVRFEDFILKQEETLERLEDFLGMPLARIIVRPDSVGRWKTADGNYNFDFLEESLEENQYHQDFV